MTSIEDMERELRELPEAIEGAALVEDANLFTRLQMREVALRAELREAALEPHRRAVERLEAELRALDAERAAALDAPPPEIPPHLKGSVTPGMRRRQVLESVAGRSRAASRDLREARKRLREAEEVNGRDHATMTA